MNEVMNQDEVIIRKALEDVYGKGSMVTSCAEYIVLRLPEWLNSEEGPLYELHMFIWCWFPGGGTAEIAANKIMAAINCK
jgi:hypothetical protein